MTLVLIILSALLSWFLCGKVRARLAAARLLDEPNDRSMHAVPVPRGGGWAIWLTVIPLWLIAAFLAGTLGQYIYLFAGLLVLIAISAFDDRKSLPVILRFGAQIFAVVLGLSQLSPDLTILGGMLPLWTDRFADRHRLAVVYQPDKFYGWHRWVERARIRRISPLASLR